MLFLHRKSNTSAVKTRFERCALLSTLTFERFSSRHITYVVVALMSSEIICVSDHSCTNMTPGHVYQWAPTTGPPNLLLITRQSDLRPHCCKKWDRHMGRPIMCSSLTVEREEHLIKVRKYLAYNWRVVAMELTSVRVHSFIPWRHLAERMALASLFRVFL